MINNNTRKLQLGYKKFKIIRKKHFTHYSCNNDMDETSKALFRLGETGFLVPIMLFVTVVCLLYYLQYKQWAKYSKIPGPRPLPFLGNLLEFIAYDIDVLRTIAKISKPFNGLFMLWVGRKPLIAITEPEHLRVFYTNSTMYDRADIVYPYAAEVLGKDSIICANGEMWKKSRKMLLRTFHPTPNDTFLQNFLMVHKDLIQYFREKSNGSTFSCHSVVKKMFLDSIIFSATLHKISANLAWEIIEKVDFLMETIYKRQFALHLRYNWIFQWLPTGRRLNKYVHAIQNLGSDYVDQNYVEMQQMIKNGEQIPNLYIYNMLRKFGDESLDVIKFELLNLIVAGMDTTANTICFTLLMCGLFPEVQERIYQEDQEVIKSLAGKDLEVADLEKYEYLDRVIKETLRFFPLAPIIGRKLGEDTCFGEYLLPKGTDVIAVTYITYRNPELFPDPLKFDPDRFLPENVEKRHPYAYNPFSAGPRGCPGKRYALIGVKAVLPAIIREFVIKSHYSSLEEVIANSKTEITMSDKQGFPIRVLPRSR